MCASKWSRFGYVWLVLGTLSGCGQDSDRPSEVHTLRVLAVRSETPFTKPASSAGLSMLAYDGSPRARLADGSSRSTSTLWIGGCINPNGDNYAACMPYLHEAIEQLGDANLSNQVVPTDAPAGRFGWGQTFTAQVPADIISSRVVAPGVVYPYGVQIVFFAYCGGLLKRVDVESTKFPLGCFDAQTGEALGRDDFEYGFYPIFSYESLENQNPTFSSIRFDGHDLGAACSDVAPCSDGLHCGSAGLCIPVVQRCTQPKNDDCPGYSLSIEVPRTSAELATVAHVTASDALTESLWVSYYSNAGSFEQDARVINDPQSGWNDDTAGKWRANVDSSREVRLWVVVRDNRNGVTWVSRDVWVQ